MTVFHRESPNGGTPSARPWPDWAPYALVVGVIAVLVVSLAATALRQERQRHRERAVVATQNISRLLDRHVSDVFDKIDLVLLSEASDYHDQIAQGRLDPVKLNAHLAHQESLVPEVLSLRIADKYGRVQFGSGVSADKPVSIEDRDYFVRARDEPNAGLTISGPIYARISRQWVIVFARRLSAPDGSFAGVIYANFAVAQFDNVFSLVALGPHGAATIRSTDLTLVHRFPDTKNAVGTREVSRQLRDMVQANADYGEYVAATAIDGIERVNAYRKLRGYPFIVVVGLATDDYLMGWQSNALILSGLAGLAILITGLAATMVYRTTRRLAADIEERNRIAAELARHRHHLEDEVASRTADLQQSMENTRLFIKQAPISIAMLDRDMNYLATSGRWIAEHGRGFCDLVGRNHYEVNPDLPDEWKAIYRRGLAGETIKNDDDLWYRSEGTWHWLRWVVLPWTQGSGGIGGIIISTEDITEAKLADEARRQSEARATAALRRLDAHISNSPLAIVEFDPEFRVMRWSKEAERLFGWSETEILGRTKLEMHWVHEDDVDAVTRSLGELISGGRPNNLCSNRNYRKDGTVIHCEWHNSALHDQGGALISILCQVLDVTERNQASAALSVAKEAAEQANRMKSAFLATISHEIRTPLHIIIGLAHLLRRDLVDPMQKIRLEQLSDNSDHLLALVNDVLDLSKIEADRLVLDDSGFRLGTVIDRVLAVMAKPAHDKSLELTADITPALYDVELRGDPVRLGQVLINLVNNAVKFTEAGSVRLGISALAENADRLTLGFRVEDTGIGIAAADRMRLFQPFTQLDGSPTRIHGGSGLGLAISRRLVALMGGDITVESEPGAGSRFGFELTLPRAVDTPTAMPRKPADLSGLRVLFAEDHPLSQDILFEMLEGLGCDVEVASDGGEAVKCAQARSYDLILMDMQMPGMDGLAATRAIRAMPEHRGTPIIALTANAFAEDRRRCLDAGMDGYISKPVTPATLAAALCQWLPDLAEAENEMSVCDDDLSRAMAAIRGLKVGSSWRRSSDRLAEYCVLLDRFVQTHGRDMARLLKHLAAAEFAAAHVVAHNLKGSAGLIGAERVASLAGEIDVLLRVDADQSALRRLTRECEVELERLKEAVQALPIPQPEPSAA